jgi:hypothetical protein
VKANDTTIGLMLALVGVGILVAWRSGALKGLLGGADYSSARPTSERAARSGIMDVADRMRALPPAVSTNAPGGGDAAAGLPDDGYSSTIAPLVSVWAPGGFLDESSRALRRAGTPITNIIADRAPAGGSASVMVVM